MKIELKPVTRDNWRECIRLEVAQDQKAFVAPNVGSLAESRFEPHYEPRAIYADGRMAGFAMYCPDEEESDDEEEQDPMALWNVEILEHVSRPVFNIAQKKCD